MTVLDERRSGDERSGDELRPDDEQPRDERSGDELRSGGERTADDPQDVEAGPEADHPAAIGPSRIAVQVGQFHRAFGLPLRTLPEIAVGAAQTVLRQALIDEEVAELRQAAVERDLVGIADALADIVYVAYGTAHVYGIDLDAVLDEVHASNMTKLDRTGNPVRRADGKVLKGPEYRRPDVAAILAVARSTMGRTAPEPAPPEARTPGGGGISLPGTTGAAAG